MARTGPNLADIRDQVVTVLLADPTVAAAVDTRVYPSRILTVQTAQVPCLLVYAKAERGQMNGYGANAPNFGAEFDIEIELHVTGTSDMATGDAADLMSEVCNAVLSDPTLGTMVDGWVRYTRDADVGTDESKARRIVAVCTITGQGQVAYTVGA